jgi:NADH dehydrogenase
MARRAEDVGSGAGDRLVPRVVVVGGGFTGLSVVRELANKPVNVTIVDQHNFHTFLPLLYQVATAGLEPSDVAYPIRTIFGRSANVRFRHGRVNEIDHERCDVHLADGGEIPFNHLVIASGATVAFFGVAGAAEHSLPLYTLADARHLRNRLLGALEEADSKSSDGPVGITIVVVGGGPTGVETAGALTELLEVCTRRDRLMIDRRTTKVVLVDVAPRVLGAFPESASRYALEQLRRRGVEVRLGDSVVSVDGDGVRLSDGDRIETTTVVWAAGVTAHGTLADLVSAERGGSGRLQVNADLSAVGRPNTWAVGDAAAVINGPSGAICPQLAPVAIQSGRHCAAQILNVTAGRPTEPFRYRDKGIMATIGRRSAVAALRSGPVVRGTLGWLAWLGLHLFYLIGFRNRLRVLVNWTWRYFDWPSGPRLIIADAETDD